MDGRSFDCQIVHDKQYLYHELYFTIHELFWKCKNPKIFSSIQIGFTLFLGLRQINYWVYSLLTFNYLKLQTDACVAILFNTWLNHYVK